MSKRSELFTTLVDALRKSPTAAMQESMKWEPKDDTLSARCATRFCKAAIRKVLRERQRQEMLNAQRTDVSIDE